MTDNDQALASLRFVSRWGFLLIGVPAFACAIAVGYIVGDAARDGHSEVIAASASTVAATVLDPSDLDGVVAPEQGAQLDAIVQTGYESGAVQGMRLANSDGLVVYSTDDEERGCELDICPASEEALGGELHAEVVGASSLVMSEGRVLEVSAPLYLDSGETVDGFVVAVQPYAEVLPSIQRSVGAAVLTVFGAGLFAFLGLQLVVRRAVTQIERDREDVEQLNRRLAESASDMVEQALGTFQALLAVVDAKDSYTARHSINVAELAIAINCHLLHPADAMRLERAALLHDIGKIGVSETVLSKPWKLDEPEWAAMREHPGSGAEILAAVPFMSPIVDIIRHHHERWDGKGYPDGLVGDAVPLEARILSVADSYDAMTTQRSYSAAMSSAQARDEIRRCSGTQFDPLVVEAFVEAFEVQGIGACTESRSS